MWPFKKKEKKWKPKSDFDYWALGLMRGIKFRQAFGKPEGQ